MAESKLGAKRRQIGQAPSHIPRFISHSHTHSLAPLARVEGDFVVVAVGATPNLDLFKDKLDISKDINGVVVDDQYVSWLCLCSVTLRLERVT